MPVDAKRLDGRNAQSGEIFTRAVHMPHWATCPDAQEFRKSKPKPETGFSIGDKIALPTPDPEPTESDLMQRLRERGVIR